MSYYFIGGLGCNADYPQEFFQALNHEVTYLDAYQERIRDKESLTDWFLGQVSDKESVVLIAHSLGADLAAYLSSQCPCISYLILLDGGYLEMDRIYPLTEELEEARTFLEEYSFQSEEEAVVFEKSQASVWSEGLEKAVRANLFEDSIDHRWKLQIAYEVVENLLTLRRAVQGSIQRIQSDCLLLIPELQKDKPTWLEESLAKVPSSVQVQQILGVGHDLYLDNPSYLAQVIQDFLTKN